METNVCRPVAIDLYGGVGGLSLGIKQAGFDVVASVEADPLTARYYRYNHPGTKVLAKQVDLSLVEYLTAAIPSGRELALVAGGPPCQGFSFAGRRRNNDRRNEEISCFAQTILALRPLAFVMENVRGILSLGAEQLGAAKLALTESYLVGEPQLLRASDFGVPQARQRVFLVGIRRDIGIVPQPIYPAVGTCPTVADAILDLPTAPPGAELAARGIPFVAEPQSPFAKEMRGLFRSPDDYHDPPAWDERFCTNAVPTRHGKTVRERFGRVAPGERDPVSKIRRLDPDGVASTIRAGTDAEHGSRSAPRPIHPFEDRVLTTRECARLQSFPDWYIFHPTRWHGNRQVGNAVPPLLARAVACHIRHILGLESGTSSEPLPKRDHALIAQDYEGAPWLSTRSVAVHT